MITMTLGLVLGGLTPAHAVDVDITGQVVDSSGIPIDGAIVEAFPADGPRTEPVATDFTHFDEASEQEGFYRLVVPEGSYVVEVSSPEGGLIYESTYYGGGDGTPVDAVGAGAQLDPIMLFTPGEPRATGLVTDPAGSPLAGTQVSQFIWDGGAWVEGPVVRTGGDGRFVTGSPADSRFTFGFEHPDHHPEFFGGGSVLPETADGTNSLPAGTTSVSTTVLQPLLEGIHVFVWDTSFAGPAPSAKVSLQPQTGGPATVLTADENGEARFGDLADGQYVVQVVPGNGYAPEGDPQVVNFAGGIVTVDLDVTADLVLVNTEKPVITGSPSVSGTLTATPGVWSAGRVEFAYQWLRDGAPIAGATGTTYVVSEADVTKSLAVVVTATRSGFETGSATSNPVTIAAVGGGDAVAAVNTVAPAVSGDAKVGQVLTATSGTWDQDGLTFTYQWLRNGSALAGATGSTMALTPADLGEMVAVEVTARRAGQPDGVARSTAVQVVRGAAPVAVTMPSISGDPVPGSDLTAAPGSWNAAGLAFTYQWMRDGTAIAGAESETYRVVPEDAGSTLSAVVNASRDGYEDGSAETAGVDVVQLLAASSTRAHLRREVIERDQVGKVIARVTSGDEAVRGVVALRVGGEVVREVQLSRADDGRTTFRLRDLSRGRHTIRVLYRGSDGIAKSRSERLVLKVVRPSRAGRSTPGQL